MDTATKNDMVRKEKLEDRRDTSDDLPAKLTKENVGALEVYLATPVETIALRELDPVETRTKEPHVKRTSTLHSKEKDEH